MTEQTVGQVMGPGMDFSLLTGGLDLGIEDLESLDAPWNWGHFFIGFGSGLTMAGLYAAGAAFAAT